MFMLSQKHINSLGQWTSIYVHFVTKAHQQPRVVDIYICSFCHKSTSIAQGSGIYICSFCHKSSSIAQGSGIYICSCPHKSTSIPQSSGHLYMFMLSLKHITTLGQQTSIYVYFVTKAPQQPSVVYNYICSCPHKGTSIAQSSGHLYMFMLSQKILNSLGQWTSIYVHVVRKEPQYPRVVDIYICSCCHKTTSIAQGSGHLYMFMFSERHINTLGQWTPIYVHAVTKAP